MEQHLQAIVTLLSLVNPVICGVMFAQAEAGQPRAIQLIDATKAALALLLILVVAALLGARVLELFGVSLDAFSIAGGAVLAWIGFTMLRGSGSQARGSTKADSDPKPTLTPIILFAASPGTITGVITLALAHGKRGLPVTALVAIAVTTVTMWITIVLMARGGARSQTSFLRDTTTRFMGLLILAMGVQFALTGIRDFFGAQQ
jgi:multiple antibiotic resistance protein